MRNSKGQRWSFYRRLKSLSGSSIPGSGTSPRHWNTAERDSLINTPLLYDRFTVFIFKKKKNMNEWVCRRDTHSLHSIVSSAVCISFSLNNSHISEKSQGINFLKTSHSTPSIKRLLQGIKKTAKLQMLIFKSASPCCYSNNVQEHCKLINLC